MDNNKTVELQSVGEAHLYVAVAKADGVISDLERIRIPYYAQKSQKQFNVMKINDKINKTIKHHIASIISSAKYSSWSADQHLDEAVNLLKKAKKTGNWGVSLSIHKNENGLLQVALLDGYIVKESRFLKKVERLLNQI